MTTTTRPTTPHPRGEVPASRGGAPVPITPRGRRRPALMALGVALTAAGALVATWLVTSAGDRSAVLVLARDVPAGTVLVEADLRATDVAIDPGVAVVPATDEPAVVDQVAAVDLTTGSLLTPSQVAPSAPPGQGEVLVPLAVRASQLPAGGVRAGDRLLVVDTPPVGSDAGTAPASFPVTVVRLGPVDVNGVAVLDVTTSDGDGPAVAVRSATGRFALVLLPTGGQQ